MTGEALQQGGVPSRARLPLATRTPALPQDGSCHRRPRDPASHLVQGCPCARALAARAEELPGAGRKPGAPRCSPCGSRPGRGMSQPHLLGLLLLLLCCQVRMGHPARRCSAPQPAPAPPPTPPLPRHAVQQPLPSPACPAIGAARHGVLAHTRPWPHLSQVGGPRGQEVSDAPRCPQGPSAQITDFLFESWKAYSEECHRNMSRLPAPTGEHRRGGTRGGRGGWRPARVGLRALPCVPPSAELVCNRTFDKFSCWPDTLPNSTASVPCPWFLPWYQKGNGRAGMHVCTCVCTCICVCMCMCACMRVHMCVHACLRACEHACGCSPRRSGPGTGCTVPVAAPGPVRCHRPLALAVKHRHVFKTCGPDGQWVTGPRGQSLRNATQCELDAEDLAAQVGSAGGRPLRGSPPCPRPHFAPSLPRKNSPRPTAASR